MKLALALVVVAAGIAAINTHEFAPPTTRSAGSLEVVPPKPAKAAPLPGTHRTPNPRASRATQRPTLRLVVTRDWDQLAQCESGGNWHINTGNGFYGGLQFVLSTWRSFGGRGMPQDASRDEQIRVAERILAVQGLRAWPACTERLGWR